MLDLVGTIKKYVSLNKSSNADESLNVTENETSATNYSSDSTSTPTRSIVSTSKHPPSDRELERLADELRAERADYFTKLRKTISCTVKERHGSYLSFLEDEIIVDLEDVKSTFIPVGGDQVLLDAAVEPDDRFVDGAGDILEILSIRPYRTRTTEGIVTYINDEQQCGVVEKKYIFFYNVLDTDYVNPQLDDKVAITAITSDKRGLKWRCIKVTRIGMSPKRKQTNTAQVNIQKQNEINLNIPESFDGLLVEDDLKVIFKELQEIQVIQMKVKNVDHQEHKIIRNRLTMRKCQSQLQLRKPAQDEPFVLQPGETIVYEFEATAKFYGLSIEKFQIQLENGVKIVRFIEMVLVDKETKIPSVAGTMALRNNKEYTRQVWNSGIQCDVVPGEKPVMSPHFIFNRLPPCIVPEKLKELLLGKHTNSEISERLNYIVPCFKAPLSYQSYETYFIHLLYLEEIQMFHDIRRYDMDQAVFTKENEFLSLRMTNIFEARPSLIVGDSVHASDPSAADKSVKLEGSIHRVCQHKILLKFNQNFHEKYNGESYKLEFFFSRASLRKQHAAIIRAVNQFNQEFLFPSKIKVQFPQIDVTIGENDQLVCHKIQHTPTSIPWFNTRLNAIQKSAVVNILRGEARPMPYIVFGPPGTGKTVTLIEAMLQICTHIKGSRILVTTPSNSSANLIMESIINSTVLQREDFLRVLSKNAIDRNCIPDNLLPYCATISLARPGSGKDEMVQLESGLTLRCSSAVLMKYRIIIGTFSTLGTLMSLEFPSDHFSHTIIDESGQCIEPDTLIPMTLLNMKNGQIILAGDPMQLGPIVLSRLATNRGLAKSMLCRLLERFPYQKDIERFETGYDCRLVSKLEWSYRSLPSILQLYSKLFYNSELIATISETDSVESKLLNRVCEIPRLSVNKTSRTQNHGIFFIGVRGQNQQADDSPSWYNAEEGGTICQLLMQLYSIGVTADDIGIVTPYARQVKFIRERIQSLELQIPKIGSVEEFQGKERNIILLSTVRSSMVIAKQDQMQQLGFIQCTKRTNVAISRARALLVIVGNPHLLVNDACWKAILEDCITNDTYSGSDLPYPLNTRERE